MEESIWLRGAKREMEIKQVEVREWKRLEGLICCEIRGRTGDRKTIGWLTDQ